MPVTVVDPISRNEPKVGYGFAVLVMNVIRGWFTECRGITIEREVVPRAEGGVNDYEHQLPSQVKRARITLKHGLADDTLWAWFQKGQYNGQVERRNLSIVVFDGNSGGNGDPVLLTRWDLPDAYPVKWRGPGLKTDGRDALIEEVEFAYRGGGDGNLGQSLQRSPAEVAAPAQPSAAREIDVLSLAAKVYALLKEDLRVERDRLG